jgi:hypothetical protein
MIDYLGSQVGRIAEGCGEDPGWPLPWHEPWLRHQGDSLTDPTALAAVQALCGYRFPKQDVIIIQLTLGVLKCCSETFQGG